MTRRPDPDAAILRAAREARGLTQTDMANRLCITRAALTCREVRPQKALEAMRRWADELDYEWVLRKKETNNG